MNTWTEIEKASDSEILVWVEKQKWARDMSGCMQDQHWHAEGDVWTHTKMVVKQLQTLDEWPGMDRTTQLTLLFTALFHDAGKPQTTLIDDSGRTRSPKHSIVGANLAKSVMREMEFPVAVREAIYWLVRYHGRPPYLLEKEKPELEVISLSSFLNNRLLYLFALADYRGRQAKETSRTEDDLHLWKVAAEEHGCFETPYQFANDHARFLFYRNELSSLHYVPYEDYRCTVTMMAGLPGAGKDTWLSIHKPDLPMVSLDVIREEMDVAPTDEQGGVIQAAREQCREHLRVRRDFVFNATNVSRDNRKRWIDLFADYAARVEIVYLEPPLPVIFQQNRERSNPVPADSVERMARRLDVPTIAECHRLTILVDPLISIEERDANSEFPSAGEPSIPAA